MSAPDYLNIVRKAVWPSGRVDEETCRELADHLADLHDDALRAGHSPEGAQQQALAQLQSPHKIRRRVRRAQGGSMRDSFRKVLLPGVVAGFAVGIYGIVAEQVFGFRAHAYLFWNHAAFVWYSYMMLAFFLGGALGAWYSRHQGGSLRQRLYSGTFLAILNFCMFVLPITIAWAVDRHVTFTTKLEAMTGYALSQVIVPGIPMLLGTLPFLFSKEEESRQDAAPA